MPSLDDLAPYRRAKLLWAFAHFGVAGIEEMMRECAGRPCMEGPRPGFTPPVAVVGDDGRAHLLRGDRMLCGEAETERGWLHKQHCDFHQDSDGAYERTSAAVPAGFQLESVVAAWHVRPAQQRSGVFEVPPHERCRGAWHRTQHDWPPAPAKTAAVRRMRAALVEALGPYCHLCGLFPGRMVDHDHETGLVRGLLCALCNRSLEECPHVDCCPKAEYMARPPAAALGLSYPRHLEWNPSAARRAQVIGDLGFDPFDEPR
ncbi:endonuclease domain-containing protein [Streptomyces beihaiensis]|uniref:Endonuclease VII domain-containing protein n=1 Tax=Streptomyces beihaiensis TaxID=2984495 RepID=A0ABT3TU58_9ACTN|nr:endonuclease domain-containing protein [Streptomyces beihaiensis]MCX3059563.1 endonuclease VII domain-containing protein [Streptomyces beihaiensis]